MKTDITLPLKPNTMKWATENAKRQGVDITTFLVSVIDTQCFADFVEGKFEPIKKGKHKNEVSYKNTK